MVTGEGGSWDPSQRSLGLQGPPSTPGTYLVAPRVVTFINSNDTISKMSQSVEAVGPLLQGPKSYVLVVRNPASNRRVVCPPPTPPGGLGRAAGPAGPAGRDTGPTPHGQLR